jgi:hypothetical protein
VPFGRSALTQLEEPRPQHALSYYALFYRSRLVPRWLSGWGMAGAVLLLMTACLLALFSDNSVTGYTLVILPIASTGWPWLSGSWSKASVRHPTIK